MIVGHAAGEISVEISVAKNGRDEKLGRLETARIGFINVRRNGIP